MALLDGIRRLLRKEAHEAWPSIVFLLRVPHLPSSEEALQLARDAWGAAGPVEMAGVVRENSFLFRASALMFALHAAAARYDAGAISPSAVYQQAWDEHRAWLSVDLPGKRTDVLRQQGSLGQAYGTLMYFAFKYWSPNCLALYFPDERTTVPNHGDVIESIRWSRRNGMNLQFLSEKSRV